MRYITAVAAALTFTLTGHPSGLRLITGLGIATLTTHIWERVTQKDADA